MQMTRINIPVTNEELEALQIFAQRDLRHPRDQARYLLRAALGLTGDAQIAMPQNAKNSAGVRQDIPSAVLS
jgi:hypothetical protein